MNEPICTNLTKTTPKVNENVKGDLAETWAYVHYFSAKHHFHKKEKNSVHTALCDIFIFAVKIMTVTHTPVDNVLLFILNDTSNATDRVFAIISKLIKIFQ